jgi:hypothetical protein
MVEKKIIMNSNNNQAGKGDKPRNCFSKKYRDNYDAINWNKKKSIEKYSVPYDENGIEIPNNE